MAIIAFISQKGGVGKSIYGVSEREKKRKSESAEQQSKITPKKQVKEVENISSEQLNPYPQIDFICDKCRRKFKRETAYSPTASLTETYCADCVENTAEEPRIFC